MYCYEPVVVLVEFLEPEKRGASAARRYACGDTTLALKPRNDVAKEGLSSNAKLLALPCASLLHYSRARGGP